MQIRIHRPAVMYNFLQTKIMEEESEGEEEKRKSLERRKLRGFQH